MNVAALIFCAISLSAADIIDIGEVNDSEGIAIRACHTGDRVLIEIEPSNPGPQRRGGSFVTTNRLLTLKDAPMSMVPSGTNVARIRTICAGSTSAVSEVRFAIHRPVAAPRVAHGRRLEQMPMPPLPFGMVPALPGGTNDSYADYQKRVATVMARGLRRSQ